MPKLGDYDFPSSHRAHSSYYRHIMEKPQFHSVQIWELYNVLKFYIYIITGVLQPHKWENAMTLDRVAWGYRRNAPLSDYLTIHDLITTLTQTISCGGNILINVGPTHDGRIPTIMEERLRQLGSWMDINSEAVYDSTPWNYQNDTSTPGVWYTTKSDVVYAFVLTWPDNGALELGSVVATPDTSITMLGYHKDPPSLQIQVRWLTSFVPLSSMTLAFTRPC
nr:alpha-L-fucosidase-like [Cherax quadricarinatus]